MGYGYSYSCPNCTYTYTCEEGVGMLFPIVYEETIKKAKSGKMGKTLKSFFDEHDNGAIDARYVTLCCNKCGNLTNRMDLSMYVPEKGIKALGFNLDKYCEKYADYPHKCGKCRSSMHIVTKDEIMLCPNCREPLQRDKTFCWD